MTESEKKEQIHNEVENIVRERIDIAIRRIKKPYNTIIIVLGATIVFQAFTLVWYLGGHNTTIRSNTQAIQSVETTLIQINDNLIDQATLNGKLLQYMENNE